MWKTLKKDLNRQKNRRFMTLIWDNEKRASYLWDPFLYLCSFSLRRHPRNSAAESSADCAGSGYFDVHYGNSGCSGSSAGYSDSGNFYCCFCSCSFSFKNRYSEAICFFCSMRGCRQIMKSKLGARPNIFQRKILQAEQYLYVKFFKVVNNYPYFSVKLFLQKLKY